MIDPADYGWWLASRSAGAVALVAVSLSVILGLLMANNLPASPGAKRRLLPWHESTALIGLVAIALHGICLLGDQWLHPTLAQLTLPFLSEYRPLWTGLGIVAGWLAVALGLSFYARRRIGTKRWRNLHRATILVWSLAIAHALGAGSDAGSSWMALLLLVSGAPILSLFAMRLLRARPAAQRQRPSRAGTSFLSIEPGDSERGPAS